MLSLFLLADGETFARRVQNPQVLRNSGWKHFFAPYIHSDNSKSSF